VVASKLNLGEPVVGQALIGPPQDRAGLGIQADKLVRRARRIIAVIGYGVAGQRRIHPSVRDRDRVPTGRLILEVEVVVGGRVIRAKPPGDLPGIQVQGDDLPQLLDVDDAVRNHRLYGQVARVNKRFVGVDVREVRRRRLGLRRFFQIDAPQQSQFVHFGFGRPVARRIAAEDRPFQVLRRRA